MGLLASELSEILENGFDLATIGFNDQDLANILGGSAPGDGLTDPDDTPSVPIDPISVLGDVWLMGPHRLACGDSRDPLVVEKALNGVKPHLCVTDPPYGIEYDPNWRSGLDKVKRATGKVKNDDIASWQDVFSLFPGDVIYVWHSQLFAKEVQIDLEDCGFKLRTQIVWVKPHFVLGRGDYHSQHESAFYMVRKSAKNGHWSGDHKQTTVWQIANGTFQGGAAKAEDAKTGHGTQKPVECMKRPIENNSSPGHAVYDPFSGSGTTIIAAEMTGRACHAIEIDPRYVDVACRRWANFVGNPVILESTGQTFEEVALSR
jgi:DNA modification methylase